MLTTGKNNAQSMDEMLMDMNEAREKGLSVRRGQSIYKQQNGEYQRGQLQALISMNLNELAELTTKERVSLADTEEIKRRTVYYMRACEESGTFPSALGLSRSLGYSDRALRDWRNKHPDSPTGRWLEMVNDMFSDILNQSALNNNANTIMSIFLNKALYGLRDSNELIITPGSKIDDEPEYSPDEIRRRYLIDMDDTQEDE